MRNNWLSLANIALLKMARASARGISLPYFYLILPQAVRAAAANPLWAKLVGETSKLSPTYFLLSNRKGPQGRNNKNSFGFGW
jgi:hypothetical protein